MVIFFRVYFLAAVDLATVCEAARAKQCARTRQREVPMGGIEPQPGGKDCAELPATVLLIHEKSSSECDARRSRLGAR